MTGTKTLTELDILRLASAGLNDKIRKYLDKRAADPECSEVYDDIIEQYDNQLEELGERMKALEGGQNE